MAIKNRVPDLLREKFKEEKPNLKQVEQQTGLGYPTILRWSKDRVDRVDFGVLDTWCRFFDTTTDKILEYVPDDEPGD